MKPDPIDLELSKEYTRIVLGMDQLYRSEKGSGEEAALDREGLVPINLTSEVPTLYTEWQEICRDLLALQSRYLQIKGEVRRNYMQQQIGSLLCLAEWCSGNEIAFRDKVRGFLYVNENPLSEWERELLHQQLDAALTSRGYKCSLPEKVRAWETDRTVPQREVESTLKELLAISKDRVADMMFPEIADVTVVPQLVYDVPYNAYCDYVNGKMYINGDLSYTYEALKHLVTHESFPGHTTHMRIRELGMKSGEMPVDAGLVITNTASSSVFEGIADNGIFFIQWATSKDDQIFHLYQRIRSIAGLNAAHMIHAEQRSKDEVEQFLRDFAFGEENWIASRLRFITHSLRAPFIYSYWRGNEAVHVVYQRVPEDGRSRFYEFLYKNMLSADTVHQFA